MTDSVNVLCLGELLVDMVANEPDVPLRYASSFRKAPGGAPANVAVGLARLGHTTAFIGKVGKDEFGLGLEEVLRGNGVDTSGLRFDPRVPTTLAFVSLDKQKVPSYTFYRNPGADIRLRPDEVEPALFRTAKVFHFGSLSLTNQPARRATWYAARLAEQYMIRTYDPNLRLSLWSSPIQAQRYIRLGIERADVVKLNRQEMDFLTGTLDLSLGTARLARHTRLVVVTLGAEGCFYRVRDRTGHVPGFEVQVADTTGAGDGFMAGLISGLLTHVPRHDMLDALSDATLTSVLTLANAVGALTSTRPGAIPALPTQAEVDAWLAQNPPRVVA